MKLAILHYHLGLGGVTRVIANHLDALAAVGGGGIDEVTLFFSAKPPGWSYERYPFAVRERRSDLLAYKPTPASDDAVAQFVERSLRKHGATPDSCVIHTHNHSLGKNAAVTNAIRSLAGGGWPMLLQIHDFAEDFRPSGFERIVGSFGPSYGETLYPQFGNVDFGVLNNRDLKVLRDAGIPAAHLHLIPNPVSEPPTGLDSETFREAARAKLARLFPFELTNEFWLYPVRGIRRKNIGEAVLAAAALADRGVRIGITLTPTNPSELAYYDAWRAFASENDIPVLFSTGDTRKLSFAENLAACDRILTTSVAEGFGMVFLEAWLANRQLVGRNLAAITEDFVREGLDLDGLYDSLDIPADWLAVDDYVRTVGDAFSTLSCGYGRDADAETIADAVAERAQTKGSIDFGRLDETQQKRIITRVLDHEDARERIAEQFETNAVCPDRIAANADVVRSRFDLSRTGAQLSALYADLITRPKSPLAAIQAGRIVDRLLSVDEFRLIRT